VLSRDALCDNEFVDIKLVGRADRVQGRRVRDAAVVLFERFLALLGGTLTANFC